MPKLKSPYEKITERELEIAAAIAELKENAQSVVPLRKVKKSELYQALEFTPDYIRRTLKELGESNKKEFMLEDVPRIQKSLPAPPRWWVDRKNCKKDLLKHSIDRPVVLFAGFEPNIGKSVISSNLAVWLSLKGLRILCVDFSIGSDLTRYLGDLNPDKPCLGDLFETLNQASTFSNFLSHIHKTNHPNIDIVPGGLNIAQYDADVIDRFLRVNFFNEFVEDEIHGRGFTFILEKFFEEMRLHYDLIICDTPSRHSFSAIAAVNEADFVFQPMSVTKAGLLRADGFLKLLKMYRNSIDEGISISTSKPLVDLSFLLNRKSQVPGHSDLVEKTIRQAGVGCLTSKVSENPLFMELVDRGITLFHEPGDMVQNKKKEAAYSLLSKEIIDVCDEIFMQIRRSWRNGRSIRY